MTVPCRVPGCGPTPVTAGFFVLLLGGLTAALPAWGDERDAGKRAEATTDAKAEPANDTAPAPVIPFAPPMAASLTANPHPTRFEAGPLGNIFATGALSGLALWQSNPALRDRTAQTDLSNSQLMLQKSDGFFRFYVQGGLYSLPSLGTPYLRAGKATPNNFGWVPLAYATLAPSDNWSIQAGKISSLVGVESTFTFQNLNIERGLLWNPTSSVSRGVQMNHTEGPLTLAFSVNDGFYSGRLSWLSGSTTWTIDKNNTIAFVGAGNTRTTAVSTFATPLIQNNSQIYNLIYTFSSGPWTLTPNLQITYVPHSPSVGILHDAGTFGAALLANYTFGATEKLGALSLAGFSLPFRMEYITATGNTVNNSPNLLYGPGSSAWSLTLTPTYQYERFFARGEFSFVAASHTTPGAVFGSGGNNKTQARLLVETGFLF